MIVSGTMLMILTSIVLTFFDDESVGMKTCTRYSKLDMEILKDYKVMHLSFLNGETP